jgi:AcrR family transcriptional regulator
VARNRADLLAAARETFLARGYAGATLDSIAESAGFSKGVVYSHFSGKPDLFLALLEARIDDRAGANDALVSTGRVPGTLSALLRANAREGREAEAWSRLVIEFRLVASRDPVLNARYAELHDRTIDRFAVALTDALAADGRTVAMPVRSLAQIVLALDSGAVLERAADPAALPVHLLEDIVLWLTTEDPRPAPPL